MEGMHSTRGVAERLKLTSSRVSQLARAMEIGRIVGLVRFFTDDEVEKLRQRAGARNPYGPRKQARPRSEDRGR